MRTIIDIPEYDLDLLAELCEREDISRAEAIRRAVRDYLRKPRDDIEFVLRQTAGSWGGDTFWKRKETVGYVEELRGEWVQPKVDLPKIEESVEAVVAAAAQVAPVSMIEQSKKEPA